MGKADEQFGHPILANLLGPSRRRDAVVSPGRVGMTWPDREQDATERFEEDPTEAEDEGPDFTWTPRHERVPGL